MQGQWVNNNYHTTINKLRGRQFSIRDDILDRIKLRGGNLIVKIAEKNIELTIPYYEIDKKRVWTSKDQPSKFGKPFKFVYFEIPEEVKDKMQTVLFNV